jgi:hypothetical protein
MPNPAVLHHRSIKIDHQLKIVDFYIHTGCPTHFLVEPPFKNYKPDVYMRDLKGNAICVEIQITPISNKKLQTKIDEFVSTYKKEHDAQVMFLVSDSMYKDVKMPKGFNLIRLPMPKEPYT